VTPLAKDGTTIKKGDSNTKLNKRIWFSISFFYYNITSKAVLLLSLVYLSITYTLYLLAISLLLLALLAIGDKSLVLDTSFLSFLDSNYLASILSTF
jgi:hypothetical protein